MPLRLLLISFLLTLSAHAQLRATDLRCEYLQNPLAIDEPAPRLSWILSADRRAERQTAYQILVASTPDVLASDHGNLWDTGKIESAATAQVVYRGQPLPPRQPCYWKVRAWDRDGNPGPWSPPARWEMGLLTPQDWSAQWVDAGPTPAQIKIISATYHTPDNAVSKDVTDIVAKLVADKGSSISATNDALGGDPARDIRKHLTIKYTRDGVPMQADGAENTTIRLAPGPIPYLRRSFSIDKSLRSARLYATALGVYELTLNGRRVGKAHLAPGWTDYAKRVRYQAYDVTDLVIRGGNALGALVGPGWFCGHAGLFNAFQFYGKSPALLAQLELTYADGSTDRIATDETWKTHPGPLLLADLLKGETFDAAASIPDWNLPAFDDAAWTPATVRTETRNLQCDIAEPVEAGPELPAKAITEPAPGRWTFDLAQNMVGVVRLRVQAPRGTVITLRHGEMLNPDGTLYTANLRGATSTDTYICAGTGIETWQPRFTFHGFRYVELTGLAEKPPLDTITGIVLGSALPLAGEFSCSDASLNQLQSNINWGLRGNYLSIPTDCPQRDERMGWMADAQVFVPTAAYNADIAAFMTGWMIDVDDAQRADGAHSDVAPVMKGLTYGTPAWADAGTIIPWAIYQTYGDTRILERHIGSMIRFVQWCKQNSTDLIRDHARGNDYGDWLSINADTPKDLIGTAYFAHSADLVARSLKALGRSAESAEYDALFADIKSAFNKRYVAADGLIHGNTQCCYILALQFNLLPESLRANAAQRLADDIKSKDWHLSTGFVGVSHLLPVLTSANQPDLAHRLLMQDTFPSWLFSVKHGATTIWERWDGWTPEGGVHRDAGMNSFNHYSLGSCGQWLFESVAGIAQDPAQAGFSRIIIRPRLTPTLTSAQGTYRSIRGPISTHWTTQGDLFTLNVTIPPNTTATIYIPSAKPEAVQESAAPLSNAEGIKLRGHQQGETILEVGSGTYEFTAKK